MAGHINKRPTYPLNRIGLGQLVRVSAQGGDRRDEVFGSPLSQGLGNRAQGLTVTQGLNQNHDVSGRG